jgi:hypothetical protein
VSVIVGLVGLVAMITAVVAAYYAVSFAVLFLVGKAFPLAGRRRRARTRDGESDGRRPPE